MYCTHIPFQQFSKRQVLISIIYLYMLTEATHKHSYAEDIICHIIFTLCKIPEYKNVRWPMPPFAFSSLFLEYAMS